MKKIVLIPESFLEFTKGKLVETPKIPEKTRVLSVKKINESPERKKKAIEKVVEEIQEDEYTKLLKGL